MFKILPGVMELCTRGLGGSVSQLRSRGIQLGCVRTLVVVAEERPRISLCSSFAALFAPLGLSPRAVSTSFGCRQNIAICLQVGGAHPDPDPGRQKLPTKAVLRNIFVWIRIRIRGGSMPLTNGSGSGRPKKMWIRFRNSAQK
jgi:hypothetical protein